MPPVTTTDLELDRLREAAEKSIPALCLMVGEMRDKRMPRGAAVLQEILDRLRAALTTEQ